MEQLGKETNAYRTLPGGARIAIAESWPSPFQVLAREEARLLGAVAFEDHDGWQPVRARHEPPHATASRGILGGGTR